MLASELAARANKLDREHRERQEKERRALEKERILQERQRQREEAAAAQRAARLAAQEAVRAAEEERIARLTESNGGAYLRVVLQAAPAQDEEERAQRGLRRSGDKVLLPPSAGQALMDQGVMWRGGALTFEVAVPSGARTHAGLLEFTAPEGVVLVPRKVAESLWGPFDDAGDATSYPQCVRGPVTVTFKRLETGQFCRLQPALRAFHEHVAQLDRKEQDEAAAAGGAMRAALEAALSRLTVLTEGDWVRAELPGVLEKEGEDESAASPATEPTTTTPYLLRVVELRPGAAVSILETDLATDVGPSIETEGYLRDEQERLAREEERARQEMERAAAEAAAAERAAADAAARRAAARLQRRAACAAALPPEPPSGADDAFITCALRLPGGERAQRRFLLDAPLSALYDFAESVGAEGGGGMEEENEAAEDDGEQRQRRPRRRRGFALVSQFPRRVFEDDDDASGSSGGGGGAAATTGRRRSLRDCGFSAGEQVALMVEATSSAGAAPHG
jgi:ubiquitin fusion degradation protein 1